MKKEDKLPSDRLITKEEAGVNLEWLSVVNYEHGEECMTYREMDLKKLTK